MNRQFLIDQIRAKQSYLCVGLDTDLSKIPQHLGNDARAILRFNKAIIDATAPFCVAYKINTAFYEALGVKGWEVMEETVRYIPDTHFKIADAKRGDIGNTSTQYAKAFFETLPFDAITVAPYMGEDSIRPFLEYKDKFTIVLGLTSNAGAKDFEMQKAGDGFLYEKVLQTVSAWGSEENLMFVVGATRAEEFSGIRKLVPRHFLLVPGVGAQGGSLEDVTRYGKNEDIGLLVNASRAVIYAGDKENFDQLAAEATRDYQQEMSRYLSN